MSEESLFSAARRVLRFIRIDDAHGGLLSNNTVRAADTLDKQVRLEAARQAARAADAAPVESQDTDLVVAEPVELPCVPRSPA